jgi:hypothetical protein
MSVMENVVDGRNSEYTRSFDENLSHTSVQFWVATTVVKSHNLVFQISIHFLVFVTYNVNQGGDSLSYPEKGK